MGERSLRKIQVEGRGWQEWWARGALEGVQVEEVDGYASQRGGEL